MKIKGGSPLARGLRKWRWRWASAVSEGLEPKEARIFGPEVKG
jgi:hypothetical protein